jgi:hypothetical protein
MWSFMKWYFHITWETSYSFNFHITTCPWLNKEKCMNNIELITFTINSSIINFTIIELFSHHKNIIVFLMFQISQQYSMRFNFKLTRKGNHSHLFSRISNLTSINDDNVSILLAVRIETENKIYFFETRLDSVMT